MSDDVNKEQTTKRLSMEDLKNLVAETVAESMKSQVEEAIAPLKEQVTSWGDKIVNTSTRSNKSAKYFTDPDYKGFGAARVFRAMAAGRGDPAHAAQWAQKAYDDELGDQVVKALAGGDFTAGGFMVPEDLELDIIDLLRDRAIVRKAGTPTVPMPRGTLTLPKQTGDITATYVGENQDITKTEPVGGQILLSAKKLAAIVPISNDLLQYDVGDAADRFVRDSIVKRFAVREDQAFLRDDGTEAKPRGIRFWAQAANVTATNGTSAANIESDFKDLIQDLEGNNVDMTKPVWFMAPRSKNHLITLRDANGNLIYPELRNPSPTIHTFPIFTTNSIPTNLGGATNETELYLCNVSDMLIAEVSGMELTVDGSASYVEGGSLVSAFSRDQTAIRAIMKHDFAVIHQESVAIKTAVTWGA